MYRKMHAASAPIIWDIMYGNTQESGNLFWLAKAIVTAGFMCAPETCPSE